MVFGVFQVRLVVSMFSRAANPPITQCPFSYLLLMSTSIVVLRELEERLALLPDVATMLPSPIMNCDATYIPRRSIVLIDLHFAAEVGAVTCGRFRRERVRIWL